MHPGANCPKNSKMALKFYSITGHQSAVDWLKQCLERTADDKEEEGEFTFTVF